MTIPSFTSYQPPGVYVQDVSTPVVVPTLIPSQVVTLVGPALGYRSAAQGLLISAATAVPLTFRGVFTTLVTGPPAIAAPVVKTLTGTTLTAGVDYTLSTVADPSGNAAMAITSILRVSGSVNVSEGQQVTIVYNYADASYYSPQVFSDPQSVINAFGPPFVMTAPSAPNASQVANPLTAAALVAFSNGATDLICVAINPAAGTLDEQYTAAYAQVATMIAATIVVPVFTDDLTPQSGTVAALTALLAADLNAAMWSGFNSGYPRMGFFGLPRNYSESDESLPTFTATLASRRIVVTYPEVVLMFNGSTNQTFQASGCYMAVALASILSSLPIDTGITNQTLNGFVGLTQAEVTRMTLSFMNTVAAAGCSICYLNYLGALTCRQGLTTDMTAVNFSEISMVRQSDNLMIAVQQGLQGAGLIGSPITQDTISAVSEATVGVLEAAITNRVIIDYINLSVQQETYPGGNPTVIDVTFQYQPAEPLNYITVTMSVDLSNGLVATQAQQNASANGA